MKYGLSNTVIQELQAVFRKHSFVERVILFGSRAKGNYHAGSDIDLAVVAFDMTYTQLLTISTDIDDLNLLYKVDLLDYNRNIGTPIGEHIDRVGKVFYYKNKSL